MDNKNWTDQLPDLLQGFEESAPEGLWDAVQSGMARKRRQRVAWWISGAVAAAAAVVLAVFLWPVEPTVTLVPGADSLAKVEEETEAPVVPEPEEIPVMEPVTGRKPASSQTTMRLADAGPQPVVTPSEETPAAQPETLETPTTPEPSEPSEKASEPGKTTEPEKQNPAAESPRPETQQPVIIPLEQQIRRNSAATGGLRLALRTEGCLSPSQSLTTTGYGLPSASGNLPGNISLRMVSRNKASTSQTEHSQSARLSLGVQYAFLPRLAVESGLSLTTLQSHTTTVAGAAQTTSNQKMQYLGIPLMLHFDALQWKRLGLYLQAGPMFEWCIGTQVTENSELGDRQLDGTLNHERVKDNVWSLQAAAGVQLKVFSHGALFVQPGFSWHFPGTGEVENYYTTHPAAFSLSFGYRFLL